MKRIKRTFTPEDIVPGATFSNGKSCRKVLDTGPQYKLIHNQEDDDCVRYVVVLGRCCGGEYSCTRKSFYSWAKFHVNS